MEIYWKLREAKDFVDWGWELTLMQFSVMWTDSCASGEEEAGEEASMAEELRSLEFCWIRPAMNGVSRRRRSDLDISLSARLARWLFGSVSLLGVVRRGRVVCRRTGRHYKANSNPTQFDFRKCCFIIGFLRYRSL